MNAMFVYSKRPFSFLPFDVGYGYNKEVAQFYFLLWVITLFFIVYWLIEQKSLVTVFIKATIFNLCYLFDSHDTNIPEHLHFQVLQYCMCTI